MSCATSSKIQRAKTAKQLQLNFIAWKMLGSSKKFVGVVVGSRVVACNGDHGI
jgi:hypothetical protein